MPETTTVSIRIGTDLLEHIDHSAAQAGVNRTNYILAWLPDYYASTAETTPEQQSRPSR